MFENILKKHKRINFVKEEFVNIPVNILRNIRVPFYSLSKTDPNHTTDPYYISAEFIFLTPNWCRNLDDGNEFDPNEAPKYFFKESFYIHKSFLSLTGLKVYKYL